MKKIKIYITSDHRGFALKEQLKKKFNLIDLGPSNKDLKSSEDNMVDYPIYANKLANRVLKDKAKGIVICGSGIGFSIAVNRFKGIRAALCRTINDAETARLHNDANVLSIGADVTNAKEAEKIVKKFFSTDFSNIPRYIKRNKSLDK